MSLDHDIWFVLEEKLRSMGNPDPMFAAAVPVLSDGYCRASNGDWDYDEPGLGAALLGLVSIIEMKGKPVPDFREVDLIQIDRIESLLRRLAPPRATRGFVVLGRGYCRAAWDVSEGRGEPIIEIRAPTLADLGIEMIARLNAMRAEP